MSDVRYTVEYAKSGRSTCKKTKEKIPQGAVRIGKITRSPFDETQDMCVWFLPNAFFEMMRAMRKTSKRVESLDDLDGYTELEQKDQDDLAARILSFWDTTVTVTKKAPVKRVKKDEDEDEKSSPKKAKKAPAAPKRPKNEPHPSEMVPCTPQLLKELAKELVERARKDGIKVPTDPIIATQATGVALMAVWNRTEDTVDFGKVLDTLEKTHGTTKGQVVKEVACEENRPLMEIFSELSLFYLKSKNTMKGISFKKVAQAISVHEEAITNGKQAAKIENIGKSSANRIDEYFLTGKVQELEDFRAAGN